MSNGDLGDNEMSEEKWEELQRVVEELDRLKKASDENALKNTLKNYRETGLRQLRAEFNEMDLVTLQYTYDMALFYEEFEVCEVALPILNKKKN